MPPLPLHVAHCLAEDGRSVSRESTPLSMSVFCKRSAPADPEGGTIFDFFTHAPLITEQVPLRHVEPSRALPEQDGDTFMRRSVICVVTAVGIFAASQALAETVVITPDERTAMREYVVKEKIRPRKFREKVVVGATLPEDVELAPVPEAWPPSVRSYSYVYGDDDHLYFADPSDRRVIHID
jgi:hypothetical protein